jgi:hypothetical protein
MRIDIEVSGGAGAKIITKCGAAEQAGGWKKLTSPSNPERKLKDPRLTSGLSSN